jgi:hypothetical protein
MTEADWLACTNPNELLRCAGFRSYERKSRLFAVACCRRAWDSLVDERSRTAVEVAERFADGGASSEEIQTAKQAAWDAHQEMHLAVGKHAASFERAAALTVQKHPFNAAIHAWMMSNSRIVHFATDPQTTEFSTCVVTRRSGPLALLLGKWKVTLLKEPVSTGAGRPILCALVRCVFGNPFRRVAVNPAWLSWNDSTVRRLAQAIYDDRQLPYGLFDRSRLAILTDALEEAGCDNADILNHCRQPGDHARGCWAVDLLLGKS